MYDVDAAIKTFRYALHHTQFLYINTYLWLATDDF